MHTLDNEIEITSESKSEVLREELVNRLTIACQTMTLESLYEHTADFLEQFERITDSKKRSVEYIRPGCITTAETAVENIAEFLERVSSFIYSGDDDFVEESEEF